jgi:hypothetical protein
VGIAFDARLRPREIAPALGDHLDLAIAPAWIMSVILTTTLFRGTITLDSFVRIFPEQRRGTLARQGTLEAR